MQGDGGVVVVDEGKLWDERGDRRQWMEADMWA